MNPFMMKMMQSVGKMKEGMEKVSVEGRAGVYHLLATLIIRNCCTSEDEKEG